LFDMQLVRNHLIKEIGSISRRVPFFINGPLRITDKKLLR
jgi:hypothetical protein